GHPSPFAGRRAVDPVHRRAHAVLVRIIRGLEEVVGVVRRLRYLVELALVHRVVVVDAVADVGDAARRRVATVARAVAHRHHVVVAGPRTRTQRHAVLAVRPGARTDRRRTVRVREGVLAQRGRAVAGRPRELAHRRGLVAGRPGSPTNRRAVLAGGARAGAHAHAVQAARGRGIADRHAARGGRRALRTDRRAVVARRVGHCAERRSLCAGRVCPDTRRGRGETVGVRAGTQRRAAHAGAGRARVDRLAVHRDQRIAVLVHGI